MRNITKLGRFFGIAFYVLWIGIFYIDAVAIKNRELTKADYAIIGVLVINFVIFRGLGGLLTTFQYGMYQCVSYMLLALSAYFMFDSNRWLFYCVIYMNGIFQYLYFDSKLYLLQIKIIMIFTAFMGYLIIPDVKDSGELAVYMSIAWIVLIFYIIAYYGVRHYELMKERHEEQSLSLNDMLKVVEEKGEEAKIATKTKSAFLASMSHEIRTPINTAIGMNEMIIRECRDKKILGYAEDAKSAETHLLMLVNDILDFSKMESGKMEIVPVEYDFRSLLHDVYVMFASRIEQKNIKFKCIVDSELPSHLIGDDVRVKQILTNLLSNAVKYTNEGTITFAVSLRSLSSDRVVIKFKVRDTGIGIKEEDMDKLFEAFRRIGEQSGNRYIQGTGLGMSITSTLLELMDSRLEVHSEFGKGSEFSFLLSQKAVDDEKIGDFAKKIYSAPKVTRSTTYLEAKDTRLLVVDDNPMNIVVFKNYVKFDGIKVDQAESGFICCDKVKENKYDLIFMDHMMPGMDGVQTLKTLQAMGEENLNHDTPVIMLTATATAHIREQFLNQGFSDYLSKPIDSSKLLSKIGEYLPDKVSVIKVADEGIEEEEIELPTVDGMDAAFAKSHFADTKQLIESIRMFIDLSESDMEQLDYFYTEQIANNEFSEYRTKVHSMKSSATVIGMIPIAGMAKVLENAAASEDRDTIEKTHGVFLKNWAYFTDLLGVFAEEDEDNGGKQPASENTFMIENLLAAMKTSADEVELDSLDGIMEMLNEYSYNGESKKFIKDLGAAVKLFDTDKISSLIDDFLSLDVRNY